MPPWSKIRSSFVHHSPQEMYALLLTSSLPFFCVSCIISHCFPDIKYFTDLNKMSSKEVYMVRIIRILSHTFGSFTFDFASFVYSISPCIFKMDAYYSGRMGAIVILKSYFRLFTRDVLLSGDIRFLYVWLFFYNDHFWTDLSILIISGAEIFCNFLHLFYTGHTWGKCPMGKKLWGWCICIVFVIRDCEVYTNISVVINCCLTNLSLTNIRIYCHQLTA